MSIFVVVQQQPNGPSGTIAARLELTCPQKYAVVPNVWLVAVAATAKDLSDRLGMSDGSCGTGIITEVGGYFGRSDPNLWTWIKTNWEGVPFA